VSTLVEDGYVLVPGVLDNSCVERVTKLVDEVLEGRPAFACERENNLLAGLRFDDPLVHELLSHRAFIDAVRAVSGATDLRWTSGYVSVREPRTGPLAWHQDWWCWDQPISFVRDAPQVAVLCYLERLGPERATLQVLPGSHRGPVDRGGARTLDLGRGDLVVLDYRVAHATTANATGRRRNAVLLNFAPRWRELAPDVRGHLVSHLALPGPGDATPPAPWLVDLLPTPAGPRRDLPLNRYPPWSTVDM
jgi:ectoine hydroxylase-related dioxygenase (phytanoyl-CoA dioxygenase family)